MSYLSDSIARAKAERRARFNSLDLTEAEQSAKKAFDRERSQESEFYKGLRSGMQGLESAYHGIGSIKDATLGDDEGALRKAQNAQRISENAAALGPSVTELSQVEDLSSGRSYAMGMLGQALPSLATTIAGATAGAATSGPVGAVAGGVAGATRGVGQKLALKALAKISENYTKKAIARGMAVGAYGASTAQQAGSMQQSVLDPANRAAWEKVQRGERVEDARNGVTGYVSRYIDGDSFEFQPADGSAPYQIRLPHINTPDTGQEGKDAAQERFRVLTDGRRLSHAPADKVDRYGRRVTDVYTGDSNESVGRRMLSSGAATVHPGYPGQEDLYKQERAGRLAPGSLPNYTSRHASAPLTPEQIAARNKRGDIPDAAVSAIGAPLSLRAQSLANLVGGGISAIPDSVLPLRVAQKFGLAGAAKKFVEQEIKKEGGVKAILGQTAANVGKEAAKSMPIEGATEGLQTFIERTTAKFIDQNKEVLGEEGIREILNASAAGFVGGAWGAVGGIVPNASSSAMGDLDKQIDKQTKLLGEDKLPAGEKGSYDPTDQDLGSDTLGDIDVKPGEGVSQIYGSDQGQYDTQTPAWDRNFLQKPGGDVYMATTREALKALGSKSDALDKANSLEKAVARANEKAGDPNAYKIVSLRDRVEAEAEMTHPGDPQAQAEYVREYAKQKFAESKGVSVRAVIDANGAALDEKMATMDAAERTISDPTVSIDQRAQARQVVSKLKPEIEALSNSLEEANTKLEKLSDHSVLFDDTDPASYLDHFQVAEGAAKERGLEEFSLSDKHLKDITQQVTKNYDPSSKPGNSQAVVTSPDGKRRSVNLRNLVAIVSQQSFAADQALGVDRAASGLEHNLGSQLLLGLSLLDENGVIRLPKTAPGQKSQMAMRQKLIERLGPDTVVYQKGKKTVTVKQALTAKPQQQTARWEGDPNDIEQQTGQEAGVQADKITPVSQPEAVSGGYVAPNPVRSSDPRLDKLKSTEDRPYSVSELRTIAKRRERAIGRGLAEARADKDINTALAMVEQFVSKKAMEGMRGQPRGTVRLKALRLLEQAQQKAKRKAEATDNALLMKANKSAAAESANKQVPKGNAAREAIAAAHEKPMRGAADKKTGVVSNSAVNLVSKLRSSRKILKEYSSRAYMERMVEPAPTAKLIEEGDPSSLVRENAILKTWAQNLGLDSEITVVQAKDLEEMYARSPDPAGLRRRVETGAQYGLAQYDGKRIRIFVHPRMKEPMARLETIGHELGHAVKSYLYREASLKTKNAIFDSYNKFLAESENLNITEINALKKAAVSMAGRYGQEVDVRTLNDLTPEHRKYLLDFDEWFADQTSRWLTTNAKPMNVVDTFFNRVANTFKQMLKILLKQGYRADENVSQYLESIWSANRGVDPVVDLVNTLASEDRSFHDKLAALMMHPGAGAYHAAVRVGMFQFLKQAELKVLGKVLYTRNMRNRVRTLLKADNRLDALAEQRRNPEAQLAYAYEYWSAGRLKLGPDGSGLFQKVADIVRKFFGFPDNVERAEKVLTAMVDGRVSARHMNKGTELFASTERLSDTGVQRATSALIDLAEPFTRASRALFYTADGRMRAIKNPWVTKIADTFSAEVGSQGVKDTYFEDIRKHHTQFLNQVLGIFRDKDEQFGQAFVDAMAAGEISEDPGVAKAQKSVDKMFNQLRDYLKKAGVDLGDRSGLYWPQVYDLEHLIRNEQAFVDLLLKHATDEFLGGMVKFDARKGKKIFIPGEEELSPAQREAAARRITQALYDDKGSGDGEITNHKAGQRPFMSAYDLRLIDFIPREELAPFLSKDPGFVLQSYVNAAVKRAEFTRRFGRDGEKLDEMISRARRYGLSAAESVDVENYIHAMLGTLGADKITPQVRKAMGTMMVFQNLRTLSMAAFSSLTDPLGIFMRSGDFSASFKAYKAGMKAWLADHRGDPDALAGLGEALGIVDADLTNEALNWEYGGVFLGGTAARLNNWLFKWNGLQDLTKMTRLMALDAGRSFLVKHATNPNDNSARFLDQLNVTSAEIREDMENGVLKGESEAVRRALVRFVDESILRPNASQRPLFGSDPRFMLIFHLKQFTYSFYSTILKRTYTEYADHGNLAPVMRLMTYIPAMVAADLIRDMMKDVGDDQDDDRKDQWGMGDYVWEATQRAGLLGVGQFAVDAMDAAEFGKPFPLPFAGPTAEWGYDLGKAAMNGTMDNWLSKQYPAQNLVNPLLESFN